MGWDRSILGKVERAVGVSVEIEVGLTDKRVVNRQIHPGVGQLPLVEDPIGAAQNGLASQELRVVGKAEAGREVIEIIVGQRGWVALRVFGSN